MKRSLILGVLVFIIFFAFLSGAGELKRMHSPKASFSPLIKGLKVERDLPVTENKSFAIIIYAHNASSWCERALRSVFEQDYEHYRVLFVDDASVDGTLELAQKFIVDNQQDRRVIAIRNNECLGFVGSLYRAADYCQDPEIIIPLDAQNWLTHDHVLSRMNEVFQNPDIWISFGQSMEYPAYVIVEPPFLDPMIIEKKGFRAMGCFQSPSIAFYASIFKSIQLPDLFSDGQFSALSAAYIFPLLEQSGGRHRTLREPWVFINHSLHPRDCRDESAMIQSQHSYRPLAQFPSSSTSKSGIDIILFSFDRPLQLYSALESIQRYVTGYQNLTVLYRASDGRFDDAYNTVKSAFPKVHYIKQSDQPRKDFKPLFLQALSDSPSPYVFFGVDDMIIKDFVDLTMCRQMIEKTGAYGFFLRFGRHIHHSFMGNRPEAIPPSVLLSHGVYAWDLHQGEGDWGFANNLDMTLYRKADLKPIFTQLKFKSPNSLESIWARYAPSHSIGLYFEHSKMVNLPLNIVNPSDCPHMNFMTAEELLVKFNQGFKIDIDPLYQIENPSPHFEYTPDLIVR